MKTFITGHFSRKALFAALCISGSMQAASLSQFSNMFRSVKSSSAVLTSIKNQSFASAHPILTYGTLGLATTVAILAGIEGWRASKRGEGFVNLVRKDFVKARKFLYVTKEDLVEVRQKIDALDKQIADYEAMTGYVVESVRPALVKLRDEREELVREKAALMKRLGFAAETENQEKRAQFLNQLEKTTDSYKETVKEANNFFQAAIRESSPSATALESAVSTSSAVSGLSSSSNDSTAASIPSHQPTILAAVSATDVPATAVVAPVTQVIELAQTVVPTTAASAVVTEKEKLTQQIEDKKHLLSTSMMSQDAAEKLTAEISTLVEQRDGKNPQIEGYAKQIKEFPSQLPTFTPVIPSSAPNVPATTQTTPVNPQSISEPTPVRPTAQTLAEQQMGSEIETLEKRMAPLQHEHDELMKKSEKLVKKDQKRLTLLKTQIEQLKELVAKVRNKSDKISIAETAKREPVNA